VIATPEKCGDHPKRQTGWPVVADAREFLRVTVGYRAMPKLLVGPWRYLACKYLTDSEARFRMDRARSFAKLSERTRRLVALRIDAVGDASSSTFAVWQLTTTSRSLVCSTALRAKPAKSVPTSSHG